MKTTSFPASCELSWVGDGAGGCAAVGALTPRGNTGKWLEGTSSEVSNLLSTAAYFKEKDRGILAPTSFLLGHHGPRTGARCRAAAPLPTAQMA